MVINQHNLDTHIIPSDGPGCFLTRHPEERSDEESYKILQPFGLQDDPSGKNKKLPDGSFHIRTGQPDNKDSSSAYFTFYINISTVLFHNLAAYGKPQTQTRVFSGLKRLK